MIRQAFVWTISVIPAVVIILAIVLAALAELFG
jgi:hypothetical protein